MIVTQEIARIAQALLKDSTYSLVEARWQSLTPLNLTPGQMVHAEVMANLPDSRYLVRLANQLLRMELPLNLQPGQTVELTFVSEEPRLVFALSKEANSGVPVRISDTSRWLNQLATSRNDAGQSTPLPRSSVILQEPPRDTGRLADGLRTALTRSGVFYESHLSQWVKGERPLADLLREPQGTLSRLTPGTTAGGGASSAPVSGGAASQQASTPTPLTSPDGGQTISATDTGPRPATPAGGGQPATGGSYTPPATATPAGTGQSATAGSPGLSPSATPPTTPPTTSSTGGVPQEPQRPIATGLPLTTGSPDSTQPTDQAASTRPGNGTVVLPEAEPTAQRPPAAAPDGARPPQPQEPFRPDSTAVTGKMLPGAPQPEPPSLQGTVLRQTLLPTPAPPSTPDTAVSPQVTGAPVHRPVTDQPPAPLNARAPLVPTPDTDGAAVAARAVESSSAERTASLRHGPLPPQVGVEPQTIPIIKEQLNVLATGQFTWNGQVWPGQDMEWKVEERETDGRGSGAERNWQTEVVLDLPRLGAVRATLSLGGMGVSVNLSARSEETVSAMKEGRNRLDEALDAAGILMTGFRVSHDDE